MRTSPLIFALACVNPLRAQQPPADRSPAVLTGSVVGHISYADTQLPARFATVVLVHKPTNAELKPQEEHLPSRGSRRQEIESMQVVSVSGRSGLDGTFRIDGVPAGDYLLVARVPGYLTSGASAQGANVQQQIASLPAVHVAVGQVASANLTLNRGGVLGGRVQYPDGSPVIGVEVAFQSAGGRSPGENHEEQTYLPLDNALHETYGRLETLPGSGATDDQGHYRISGLAPGKYIVLIRIETDRDATRVSVGDQHSLRSTGDGGNAQPMTVYEPGVFRRKDAKVLEIRADEQLLDADIKVDPSGLHTVRGRLVAGEDHHAPKEATVQLRESDSTDPGDMGHLAQSAPDGSFQISELPAGSYTLEVVLATDEDLSKFADEERQQMSEDASQNGIGVITSVRTLTHTYKSAKIPILLGDHDLTLDDIPLTPTTEPPATPPQ